ncbi:MAG: hypothetical protein JO359_09940 [Candidatus Eremiobacteraeota bacterium]|nr:hypothetical protein [Candidatus Eremiobacteraeota bacterium]
MTLGVCVAESERPAFAAASEQLREALAEAQADPLPIRLAFCQSLDDVRPEGEPTVAVVSLLRELESEESPASIETRLRAQLASVLERGAQSAFVCTIFRYVPDDPDLVKIERIRRLNLLAPELSFDTGACVIDIDRVFAHVGAQQLKTDYRLGGRIAAEVAGHTIVASLLAVGLDDVVAIDARERAQAFQGTIWEMARLLQRRLPLERDRAG